jgi:uncharacterized protein YjbJ (UPF0337 family)
MKALPWIIAGVGIGAGVTILLLNQQQSKYATGYDSVEDAAHKTFGWGTRQRVQGNGRSFVGAVKEGIGRVTVNADLADEGMAERAVGTAKDAAGKLGHAVGKTIHDLNR